MAKLEEGSEGAASNREVRINRLSAKLAAHHQKMRQEVRKRRFRFIRKDRKRPGEKADMVGYDLETSRIEEGTPTVKYITAYAHHKNFILSQRIDSLPELLKVLEDKFLTREMRNVKFVAWNGNGYDVYFVALAVMMSDKYVIRPYLTKGKSLRGMRVILKEELGLKPNQQTSWEFTDGISMLGLQGVSLEKFLKTFAPDWQKIDRGASFDQREFDATDPLDVEYALRDSIGLYWGMQEAQDIIFQRFNMGLRTTIGNLGIKIFESRIPENVVIREPKIEPLKIIRDYVCRGGYCHLMRKYKGKVWKYDLNQAYAAAMRETKMPAGDCQYLRGESKYAHCYIARIDARKDDNIIPFYCRMEVAGKIKSVFATTRIESSWLTNIEIQQLRSEGWQIKIYESYVWYESFDMKDFVDTLEHMRGQASGGPKGAAGTMIKGVGNNSYGKMLEQLESLELVLAMECPPGYVDYYGQENPEQIPFVWCKFIETPSKKYHQPQIGAFITAHVRMVVRRAAMLAPREFLYADTDCVIFSKDMTKQLKISDTIYGSFKLEESGAEYMLIAKKVYASMDFQTKHSKGLAVKALEFGDFVNWFNGKVPVQTQAQRQNFVKFLKGTPMFLNRKRRGTAA